MTPIHPTPKRATVPRFQELDVDALLQHAPDMQKLARLLDVPARRLYRYKDTGLTLELADRFAVALRCHPSEVWPCWTELNEAAASRDCAYCSAPFIPCGRRKFCSDRCRWNAYANRVRQTPVGKERNRQTRKRYYRENTAYERSRNMAYYRANRDALLAKQRERDRIRRAKAKAA